MPSKSDFLTPGQRWISNTESELGLGTLVSLGSRTLTLFFSAADEKRVYAREEAPITRVFFNSGDTITSSEGWQLSVVQVNNDNSLLTYQGQRLDTGEENVYLSEVNLDSKLVLNKPQDRLFTGQIDRMDRFALRFRSHKYHSEQYGLSIHGLRGARASLIPHQLHISYEVGQRHSPRVLLADEVGLGKTIEAGLIIHQQLLTGRVNRVLIVVPDALLHQWLVELLRRFNLHFSLFDDERYNEIQQDGSNPFEMDQQILCSLDFFYQNEKRLDQLTNANWDLIVIDEAHHLRWSQNNPSMEYQAIEKLARAIPSVILLTATPEQLGIESHFARLRLLDPRRFYDLEKFLEEQQEYESVANVVSSLLSDLEITAQEKAYLIRWIEDPSLHDLLRAADGKDDEKQSARQKLISLLIDRHGTSRVLFRNTRQNVKGFPQRKLHAVALPMTDAYHQIFNRIDKEKTLEERASLRLCPEKIAQNLSIDWCLSDPRVCWLRAQLVQWRDEKVLIICTHATTASQLAQYLRERDALHVAVFHENLSIIERDRAAAYFAEEGGAQTLICSEIGSEGRNFQFACHLVLFDLPLNPDLLEQRIGRLDRIGQKRDVQIFAPYLEQSPQALLLRWYHEGLNAFELTCPTGHTLYDNVREKLIRLLNTAPAEEEIDIFVHDCHKQNENLKKQLEKGRDRLLEFNSDGGEIAQKRVQEIQQQDNGTELVAFALTLFDIIGINQEDRGHKIIVLTPSEHMLIPDFPGLPEDGCLITFDRNQALAREDVQFITWEHPIIRNGIDLILSGTVGTCAVSVLRNNSLPAGTLLLELIWVVETQAPKPLQLMRFLPPTPVRLLLDSVGRNLANKIDFENLNRQLQPINRQTANKLVTAMRETIKTRLSQADDQAEKAAKQVISQAHETADETLKAELSRLKALRNVNPTIREDEINALENRRISVLRHLDDARWRLDALRVIVVMGHE